MSLVRAAFIPIPSGAKPGFDHADVYRAGRRMYVAHTGADRIDVLDCAARTYLHALPDLPGVAGVLIDDEHDLLEGTDGAIYGTTSAGGAYGKGTIPLFRAA